ncbi:MAG TPA: hypothetical protein VFC19_19395 [Candidatus Limnocylindrales bacterium]|nr:hypothetical protein [Candidatus Limnocylindrales bacterium]
MIDRLAHPAEWHGLRVESVDRGRQFGQRRRDFRPTHAQQVESVAVFTPTITEESWSILLVPMIEII